MKEEYSASVEIRGEQFLLHPLKAAYWIAHRILLVADVHLGKVTHFRKAGIAVPRQKIDEDLANLESLIRTFQPASVYFLGDLFHSAYNREAELLESFLMHFSDIRFHLIVGNHDLPGFRNHIGNHLHLHVKAEVAGFSLQHHPSSEKHELFQICGHVHPAARLKGPSRQKLKLPCFHLTKEMMVLPSFGSFTGSQIIRAAKHDRVFVVAEGKVLEM